MCFQNSLKYNNITVLLDTFPGNKYTGYLCYIIDLKYKNNTTYRIVSYKI